MENLPKSYHAKHLLLIEVLAFLSLLGDPEEAYSIYLKTDEPIGSSVASTFTVQLAVTKLLYFYQMANLVAFRAAKHLPLNVGTNPKEFSLLMSNDTVNKSHKIGLPNYQPINDNIILFTNSYTL